MVLVPKEVLEALVQVQGRVLATLLSRNDRNAATPDARALHLRTVGAEEAGT